MWPVSPDGAPAENEPIIDIAPALVLPAPTAAVLSRLFAGYARVVVEGERAGGFSGARVLTITPYRDADASDLPTVVKLGPAELIRQEFQAYRLHIRGRLSGVPEVWGEPVYVDLGRGVTWGVLRYALVGAGLFDIVSLAQFARSASAADLAFVLEDRLFVHLGTIWRRSRLVTDAPLGPAYDALLRPNLADAFAPALGDDVDLSGATVSWPGGGGPTLPNPVRVLPELLSRPIAHHIATIHGDLNLENVLVDPIVRTVQLIDFSHSREDHVLHDVLRLETGLVTRVLAAKLADVGAEPLAVVDLLHHLHSAADTEPPDAALRTICVGLIATRKVASTLLADPADWREYLVGLAAYLVGAGKYGNLDAAAKATAFWAAASALDLALTQPSANVPALERAIPVLIEQNPALEAYRRERVAQWSGPRFDLDARFVEMALRIDHCAETVPGRWQAKEERYASLRAVLDDVPAPILVILGAAGCGKSTLLRRLELELARAGTERVDLPVTFYIALNEYKPARRGAPTLSPRAWLAAEWSTRHPKMPPLDELLGEGRMILLLDALNELPASSAAEATERIGGWKSFAHEIAATASGSRVIFSCRSLDYAIPLSTPTLPVPQVRLELLSDEQVRSYLRQCLPGHEEGQWTALVASGHLDVARSPYFLRLLVQQLEATGERRLGRAALLTGFVRQALVREVERDNPLFRADALLTDRDVHRLASARDWRTPFELPERGALVPRLEALAYRMQERSGAFGDVAQVRVDFDTALDLLDHARGADIVAAGMALGVLDEDPGRDEVMFAHQLVQEYFAARLLAKAPRSELVRAEWRASEISPGIGDDIDALPPSDALPTLPQTGWEETTLLAAAMAADAETFVRGLVGPNLALAGRCAAQFEVRERLGDERLTALRWALVARSRDPAADLRDRIACGSAAGELGDPRFEPRVGPHGAYRLPPLVAIGGGAHPIGDDLPIEWVSGGAVNTETAHIPLHAVDIAPFQIGRFAVTNAEWACFVEAGGYDDERWWDTADGRRWQLGELTNVGAKVSSRWWRSRFQAHPDLFEQMVSEGRFPTAEVVDRWRSWVALDDAEFEAALGTWWQPRRATEPAHWREDRCNGPNHPVVGICWYEARAYCSWLSAQTGLAMRLPSEAEWQSAAAGQAGRRYAWGDAFDRLKANTFATKVKRSTPVGVFPDGDTPEGVADLCGNVGEWTSSLYGVYDEAPDYTFPYDATDGREDPGATADISRVVKGGSWLDDQVNARAAYRYRDTPAVRNRSLGFRLACAP